MKKMMGQLALAVGALALGSAAFAATATQTMSVDASIVASCEFGTATTLPFGTLSISDLLNGKVETIPASVEITCTNSGIAAKLYTDPVKAMGASMSSATLTYEVYTDSTHGVPLGVTPGSGLDITADGTVQTIPLYGQTTAGQGTLPADTYHQDLTLNVDF